MDKEFPVQNVQTVNKLVFAGLNNHTLEVGLVTPQSFT